MQKFTNWISVKWARLRAWFDHFITQQPNAAQPDTAWPPLNRQTAGLYADVTLQSLKTVIYYILAFLGILFIFGFGLFAGYFVSIVNTTPIPSEAAMTRTLNNTERTSSLYFAKNVKLGDVKTDIVSQKVTLSQMSPWLTKAIVATEDEDFYQHSGIVPKALVRAFFSDFTGVGSQTGGSTLTQQVVKMMFLNSETTFKRKANEIMLARRLDSHFTKDQILATYLNVATLGRNNKGQNIAGVQAAAQGLFGVDAKQLNIPQAAFIAGLPQSPSVYTPYQSDGSLKKDISAGLSRQKTVLFRMYRAGDLSKKQYDEARKYDLKAAFLPQGNAQEDNGRYGYVYNMLYSEAKVILAEQLAKQDGHSMAELAKDSALNNQYLKQAATLFSTKNYQIKSTIDRSIYDKMQTVLQQNAAYFGQTHSSTQIDPTTGEVQTVTDPVQNGSVVLNNQTGAILGFIGGVSGELNHIYTLRSPGSTIKPLLVYAPAIENKMIGSQTTLADFKTNLGNNYSVTDYGGQIQNRFIPATEALAQSYNIPAVNLYKDVKAKVDVKSYMDKMGLDTFTANDYSQLGLALGGTDYGVDVQQQASAFATFANEGNYVAPYVIDEIVDPYGHAVYKHKTKKQPVFSKATSYIMNQMLKNVIEGGTAASLTYQLDFDTDRLIGKTGTSNDYKDIWFIGSTPGITIASWLGYDNNNGTTYYLPSNSSSANEAYWAKLANAVYGLIPDQFQVDQKLARPAEVKSVTVDKATGRPSGTVSFNGRSYKSSGTTVTSLYNDWQPSGATSEFAIGGTAENYKLFYDHLNGAKNGYGQVTDANGIKTAPETEHQNTPSSSTPTQPSSSTPVTITPSSSSTTQSSENTQPSEPTTSGTGGGTGTGGNGEETSQTQQPEANTTQTNGTDQ